MGESLMRCEKYEQAIKCNDDALGLLSMQSSSDIAAG